MRSPRSTGLAGGLAGGLAFALAACALAPSPASAHGGLPIAEAIFMGGPAGDTLFVPTRFWGVFYGSEGGDWRWICEEAVNLRQDRKWMRAGDGSWHATDFGGVTSSRDGGCTWIKATGEIAKRSTSWLAPDPRDGRTMWATTDEYDDGMGTVPWNGLFVSRDSGLKWEVALQADELLHGVAVDDTGRVVVTGNPRTGGVNVPTLHVSRDGGKTWDTKTFSYAIDGVVPSRIVPLAFDAFDATRVYLRVDASPASVLLHVSLDGTQVDERARADGTQNQPGIGGVAFDVARKAVWVPTREGLLRSVNGGALAKVSNLSQAQCVTPRSDRVYACSWNYKPDEMAIGVSTDDGATFRKVFQFHETKSPMETCGATTSVGMICPQVWQTYCTQLGIDSCVGGVGGIGGKDAGSGGGDMGGGGGDGCAIAGAGARGGMAAWLSVLALVGWALRRRR